MAKDLKRTTVGKKHSLTDSGKVSRQPGVNRIQKSRKKAGNRVKAYEVLIIFLPSFFYDELLLRLLGGHGWFSHPIYVFLFTVSYALLFTGIVLGFRTKGRRISTAVILSVTALLFTIESVIDSDFKTFMSLTNLLSEAGDVAGKYSGQVGRSILFGIPKAVLFMIPVFVYLFICRRVQRRRYLNWMALVWTVGGLILCGITGLAAARGRVSSVYGSQFTYNNAVKTFGLLTGTRLSVKYTLFGHKNSNFNAADTDNTETAAKTAQTVSTTGKNQMVLDFSAVSGNEEVEELNKYLASLTASDRNEMTGLFAGKNLIMISAESYCSSFITPELTPTLWRLTHNGFWFSDYYQPEWGGSTTTGELAYLMGLAPQWGDESMINTAGNNNYFTMGNQLQRLGYTSCAFHNGSYDYYSRNTTHENLGYNQWIANETGMNDLLGVSYGSDTDMFSETIDLYISKQPFNIYYMTLSGHAPYKEEEYYVQKYYDRVNEAVGGKYEETTKYYICYQMELEESMKLLVEKLTAAGIADDTVIVLVGDHYPYGLGAGEAWGNDEDYVDDLLKDDSYYPWNRDANSLIIWSGCLEHENSDKAVEISEPVYSLDILPTLSNLFGLEFDSRLLPGRDVFADTEPLVFWNSLDWVTTHGRYEAETDTFYGNSGYEYDWDYIESINELVENKLLMSRVIVENDYYGKLFGPDTLTFAGQKVYEEGQAGSVDDDAQGASEDGDA